MKIFLFAEYFSPLPDAQVNLKHIFPPNLCFFLCLYLKEAAPKERAAIWLIGNFWRQRLLQ